MRKRATIFAVLALIAGAVAATTTASAGAAQSGVQISSQFNNRCLTVSDFNSANGAGVLMVDCQGAASQLWNWDLGRLRNVHSNKCLTAAWGNGESGAALHMWDCQDWVSQKFYRPGSPGNRGRVQTFLGGNRCVEIAGANWWQGASVQLWDCHEGRNQFWNA